jgi:hypothetical protein
MRKWCTSIGLIVLLCSSLPLHADSAKISKVLPLYLDKESRVALSPSLYERDAYQDFLRKNPEERAALRFDINWKAKRSGSEKLILRIELRSTGKDPSEPMVLERLVRPARFFHTWSSLLLEGKDYREFGRLIAWRASLWRGKELLAEQKSFLW